MAGLELIIATGSGMKRKGGGKLTIEDFLPEFAKPKKKELTPEEKEARLKAQFQSMAAQAKAKRNG